MKIFERIYDDKLNEDGTEKPNKFLGDFEIEGCMDDYSYRVYGKDKEGKLYVIIGKEISGFYHPNEGGTKNFILPLEEEPDVKFYIKSKNN